MSAFAWVTLATNDSYALGALVLAHSLRKVGTAHQIAVMVTPGVTPTMRGQLGAVFDLVHEVNVLDSNDASNLALLARPELGITFTKIHCWTLTQYAKCVFLDADTMVLQGCDELFDREELSAAPDVGWPDCFNSGVFVYKPSAETYKNILDFALAKGSFDGGDQGLLNMFFSNWASQDSSRRLPFIYNMCSTAVYSYLPAFKQYGSDAKIIHFIGPMKPWLLELDTQTGLVSPSQGYEHLRPILQQWWSIFLTQVLPKLQPDMGGMAGALANLSIGTPRSEQQVALEDYWRRQAWEHGNADYLGKDAFDKIWAKIQNTLQGVQPSEAGDAPSIQAPPPPEAAPLPHTEAPTLPTEVTTPTEQPLPTPVQSSVEEPVSVAPTSPPPGDQKTPAPISSPVQTPPTASATPTASKPSPLDANRPSAPPVSQTAPASVESSTVTPCELVDQPLSPVKQIQPPSLRPLSTSTVICTIPTTLPFPAPESPSSVVKAPKTPLVLTSPPISPTAIPLPFTTVPSAVSKPPVPLSPLAMPSSPPALPSSPPALPSSPPALPSSPPAMPSSPPAMPSSPPAMPSSPPAMPSSPPAMPSSPPAMPSSPPTKPSFPPTKPSSPPATPTSPPTKPSSPPARPSSPPARPSSPPARPSSPPARPSSPPSKPSTLSSPTVKGTTSLPATALHSASIQPTVQPVSSPTVPSPPVTALPKTITKPKSPPGTPRPIPQTPIVTDATPPTSPPIGLVTRSPEALAVGNVTPPETPPIGSGGNLQAAAENQSGAESAPIPPKRRGGPNKGGKSGQKGKK